MAPSTSGHLYSHPNPGDEVCITGIAGYFPKSDSVLEFQNNLFNKEDLISDVREIWKIRDVEASLKVGKLKNLKKFDANFFNMDYKEAHHTNPMSRLLLERTYEAIIDAGVNPAELRGTRTGVFVASCFVDTNTILMCDRMQLNDNAITGCTMANLPLLISEWLGVSGPSYNVDTACSSSLFTLDHAYKAIRDGHCDAAIVGGVNLNVSYGSYFQLHFLGLLSPDGKNKSFDESADGYVRAEAIVVCFLQKAKNSRRVHAQIIHSKTNSDGFKEQSITFPSAVMQTQLIKDVYEESDITPDTLEYMECHATGTAAGDLQELIGVDNAICSRRSKPLLVGTVKSNMGHSEPVSGLCGIAKICIAYNTGYIPPNINLSTPRQEMEALMEGRVQVVTDKLPWNRGMAAVSSFGFGGANGHCLLKDKARVKVNRGLPSDKLPRVVCVSGRTKSAVAKILRDLETRTVDVDEVRLLHAIHERDICGHEYRGYTVLRSLVDKGVSIGQEINKISSTRNKICFFYSSIDKQILSNISWYMQIPKFAESIQKCHEILTTKGINLIKLLNKCDRIAEKNIYTILVIVTQIAITDLLKKAGIIPDFIMGEGLGELCCTYANNHFTFEQTVLAAYSIFSKDTKKEMIDSSTDNQVQKFLETHVQDKYRAGKWLCSNKFRDLSRTEKFEENERTPYKIEPNTTIIGITSQAFEDMNNNNMSSNVTVYIQLFHVNDGNGKQFFQSWGKLYMQGLNPNLAYLYPTIQFPVSQGTPLLSHLVDWDHRGNWYVELEPLKQPKSIERMVAVTLDESKTEYLKGHSINDRVLYPGSGYLVLVWETLAISLSTTCDNLSVVFEEVRWERATVIPEKGSVEFTVTIHKVSGEFEITENKVTVVTGRIYAKKNVGQSFNKLPNIPQDEDDGIRLTSRDFYKEIMLRGYGHKDKFQGIMDCNVNGTYCRINWLGNWVVFLDNMVQSFILSKRIRSLSIPTRLDKLCIDTDLHFGSIKKDTKHYVDVFNNPTINVIRSLGVEMRGVHFNAIAKTSTFDPPTLECYKFIPYFGNTIMMVEDVIQIYIQMILENMEITVFKSIELFDAECVKYYPDPISKTIEEVFKSIPRIEINLSIISDTALEISPYIHIVNKSEELREKDTVLAIVADLIQNNNINEVQLPQSFLQNCGFILSREKLQPEIENSCFDIIAVQDIGSEYLVLLRNPINKQNGDRKTILKENCLKIKMEDKGFFWVDDLKNKIVDEKLILYAQHDCMNGLIGLANCLRKEQSGCKIQTFLIADLSAPDFDPMLEFYRSQIDKNLEVNVLKEGQWGTYRHLLLKESHKTKSVVHAYNNAGVIGDLSTLQWFEGPLTEADSNIVHVYSAALNFRDVMVATGRLQTELEFKDDCDLGFEVVGRTINGSRVVAKAKGGFTNKVVCEDNAFVPIPDEWTFEEAATVFITYATVYLGFDIIGNMKTGESVLIHAGAGGVGQAAINVALHHGCEVFTTVSSTEKRELLKKLFPQLKDDHIGCSRDTSFMNMILSETNGKGVDLVLNSLADDMLLASICCLADRGRFLEIGKYDIAKNTLFETKFHEHEISYHSVMLDFLEEFSSHMKQRLFELLVDGIASGAVRPLTYCTFDKNDVLSAYRYVASGKHIGKVVIKIRDEEETKIVKPSPLNMEAIPRFIFNQKSVFLIVGGLGGFGLELVHWLVMRRATKFLIVSSRGITSGYQKYRIRVWRSLGVNIQISTKDVSSENDCKEIIKLANSMGSVEGIFNLAAVLRDALFDGQTRDSFKTVNKPKGQATINLDKLSRQLCPQLKSFVMFSSLACGQGNPGQTNYGFANSVMERICEQRHREGLPALAIQWGPIGDVGLLADLSDSYRVSERTGIANQSISSCLKTLDILLRQDEPIVSSCIIIEKNSIVSTKMSLVETVAKIKGIRDLKTISPQASLSELGMDSMMAVEIKQALERDFKIFLTPKEIRNLNFARLSELSECNNNVTDYEQTKTVTEVKPNLEYGVMMSNIGNEELAKQAIVHMPSLSKTKDDEDDILFMVPGFEGSASTFDILCKNLFFKTYVLQLGVYESLESLDEIIDRIFQVMIKILPLKKPFKLLGYSFGTYIALGLAAKLERLGHTGIVFCLDGSPTYLQQAVSAYKDERQLRNDIISGILDFLSVNDYVEDIDYSEEFETTINRILEKYYTEPKKISKSFIKLMCLSIYSRLMVAKNNVRSYKKTIKSPIILLRATENIVYFKNDDYELSECTKGEVTVHYIKTNHAMLPRDKNCVEIINKYVIENRNRSNQS